MIYLASPYSSPNRTERWLRYQAAYQAAAALMRRGLVVFSPIAHSVSICEAGGLPHDKNSNGWSSPVEVVNMSR